MPRRWRQFKDRLLSKAIDAARLALIGIAICPFYRDSLRTYHNDVRNTDRQISGRPKNARYLAYEAPIGRALILAPF